jgi:hypothetical protein
MNGGSRKGTGATSLLRPTLLSLSVLVGVSGCVSDHTTHRDEICGHLFLRHSEHEVDLWALGGCGHRHSVDHSLAVVTAGGKVLVGQVGLFVRSVDDRWAVVNSDAAGARSSLIVLDLEKGAIQNTVELPRPENATVWLERDWRAASPFTHRVLLSCIPRTEGHEPPTDALRMITFTREGARIDLVYHEVGRQVRVVDDPRSPDGSALAFLVRSREGAEERTSLVQVLLRDPGSPRTVAESRAPWSDLKIEWSGQNPTLAHH